MGTQTGSIFTPRRIHLVTARRLGVLATAVAMTLSGSILTASAQGPAGSPSADAGPPGTIVFMRTDRGGNEQVWTACLDLTRERPLTDPAAGSAGWPAWSPDGTRIAFNANYDDPDPSDDREIWDIYTMDAGGRDLIRLTRSVGLDGDPAYSPDGTLIAFDSDRPGMEGINVMSAVDGSGRRLVAPLPAGALVDYAPRFSPDGKRLVFSREVDEHNAGLWIVGLDGSDLHRIAPEATYPTKPVWSPDGTTIAFTADSSAFPYASIWTVRSDGTGLTNLNTPSAASGARDGYSTPAWSPDGTLLLVLHGLHHDDGTTQDELATIRPDGTDLQSITGGLGPTYRPDKGEYFHGAYKADWRAADC